MEKEYRLIGFDALEEEFYPLKGDYPNEQAARQAVVLRLRHLNETQPPETPGGQDDLGIQDRIFIQIPDGNKYRFIPTPEEFGQKPG